MKYEIKKESRKVTLISEKEKISFWGIGKDGILQYPPNKRNDVESALKDLGLGGKGRLERNTTENIKKYLKSLMY